MVEALNVRPPQPHQTVQVSAVEASATEELDAEAADEVLLDCVLLPENRAEVVCRRWIMGMVDHFASIRVLE